MNRKHDFFVTHPKFYPILQVNASEELTPGRVHLLWYAAMALSASSLDEHTTKQQPARTQINSKFSSSSSSASHTRARVNQWLTAGGAGGAVADDGGVVGASGGADHGEDVLLRQAAWPLADEQPLSLTFLSLSDGACNLLSVLSSFLPTNH